MARYTASLIARLLTLVLTLVLTLAGCGASDAPAQLTDPSGQSPAAVGSSSVPQIPVEAPFDATGRWVGLLGCAGRDFPVDLKVGTDGRATITLAPAVNHPGYISPDGRTAIDALELGVTVHKAARVVQFVEARQPSRPLDFSLLVGPDDETAILAHGRCEAGLLQRGTTAAIETMTQELLIINEQRVLDMSQADQACPANLESWISLGEALPLDDWARGDISALWEPGLIERVFAKPLTAMGAEERQQLRQTLEARCGQVDSRRRRALIRRLMQIADPRSFRSMLYARYQRPVIDEWLRYTDEALLSRRYAVSTTEASMVLGVPTVFQFASRFDAEPGLDNASLHQRLQPIAERARQTARTDELVAAMAGADDFVRLNAIYARAAADQELDQARLRAAFAQRLPAAAKAYADAARKEGAAQQMAGWLAGRASVCPAPAETACSAAAKHFEQRLPELLESLAEAEVAALEELEDAPRTPAGLMAWVSSDRAFAQRYRGLLEQGPLADLADDRRRGRQRLQSRLKKELIEEVKQAKTTVDLAQLETRWFLDEDLDLPAAEPFRSALAQRRADQQPFTGEAGDYLNALYNQDIATLARLDRELTAKLQPILGFLAQQMEGMNTLSAELLELLGSSSSQGPFASMVNELRSPSAIKAVAMRYLLDYEEIYAACLGANAREFVFSERVDTVTQTRGGVVLSRIEGVTVATRYRVKPQLASLFQQVFTRPADAPGEALYAALFGDDGMSRLLRGVTETMRGSDCTDARILRLERGMISYHQNRRSRWASGR